MRNDAAYRLARIHFQKDQPEDALHALERIHGEVPEEIRDDIEFLRANVYMALGRPSDAVEVLERLQGADELKGFSALQPRHRAAPGRAARRRRVAQLDRAGQVASGDPATLAIRDKSNLVLGTLLFESSAFGPAQQSLDRVRLEGPFSNQALLRAGWADASAQNFERALVPWSILAEREPTDAAVQEAHARAAVRVQQARTCTAARRCSTGARVESFGAELEKIDASIAQHRRGRVPRRRSCARRSGRTRTGSSGCAACPRRPRPST